MPATGASAIWLSTAAVQMPLFAATSSSSRTSAGSALLAAGLNMTAPSESPNAIA